MFLPSLPLILKWVHHCLLLSPPSSFSNSHHSPVPVPAHFFLTLSSLFSRSQSSLRLRVVVIAVFYRSPFLMASWWRYFPLFSLISSSFLCLLVMSSGSDFFLLRYDRIVMTVRWWLCVVLCGGALRTRLLGLHLLPLGEWNLEWSSFGALKCNWLKLLNFHMFMSKLLWNSSLLKRL